MNPPEAIMLALIVIGLPTIMITVMANRFFKPRNMHRAATSSSSACACSSRSSPTAGRRRPLKSRRYALRSH